MTRRLRIDVWAGPRSATHLARQHFAYAAAGASAAEWLTYATAHLDLGRLVNLRILARHEDAEDDFGPPPAARADRALAS